VDRRKEERREGMNWGGLRRGLERLSCSLAEAATSKKFELRASVISVLHLPVIAQGQLTLQRQHLLTLP
jgi:hypothetical protein